MFVLIVIIIIVVLVRFASDRLRDFRPVGVFPRSPYEIAPFGQAWTSNLGGTPRRDAAEEAKTSSSFLDSVLVKRFHILPPSGVLPQGGRGCLMLYRSVGASHNKQNKYSRMMRYVRCRPADVCTVVGDCGQVGGWVT